MTVEEMNAICADAEKAFDRLLSAMEHTLDKACYERGVKAIETVADRVKELSASLPE